MKRRVICLLLAFLAIFAGFKSWSYTTKAEKVAKAQKTVRYHVVITDKCNSDFSQNLIESIKEAVNCKIFVLTRNLGVMLKDAAEREKIPLMEGRVCYLAKRSRLGGASADQFLGALPGDVGLKTILSGFGGEDGQQQF